MSRRVTVVPMSRHKMRLADLPNEVNDVSAAVLDAAIEVHTLLGPGLLESAYRGCLAHELRLGGHRVEEEVRIPLVYKGRNVGDGYRADLIVDGLVLVEVKASERMPAIAEPQVLTYLRLTGIRLGMLMNFHAPKLLEDFRRLVL